MFIQYMNINIDIGFLIWRHIMVIDTHVRHPIRNRILLCGFPIRNRYIEICYDIYCLIRGCL
ncbi:hypothetical protein BVRB_8g202060 isoform A [Beta vulgaris subsp. vulgaris]|uniref:Uncharacterized protein n=2 Tax=Beta vulgaris subsp. vulgaris TaxID=3555 RepID=A0A0J8E0C2_BETVV|nr:hypothetical protein BVRB_8g202060 isoform A [Beta vulgaris subsp. vulgaris]